MGWKNWQYWLKGGLFGIVAYIAVQIITSFLTGVALVSCYRGWTFKQEDPICSLIAGIIDSPLNILTNPGAEVIIASLVAFMIAGGVISKIIEYQKTHPKPKHW